MLALQCLTRGLVLICFRCVSLAGQETYFRELEYNKKYFLKYSFFPNLGKEFFLLEFREEDTLSPCKSRETVHNL